MIDNQTRRMLLQRHRQSGFPGSIMDVFRAAEQGVDLIGQYMMQQQQQMQQQPQVASTPEQYEQGLRPAHQAGNTNQSMVFPNVPPNTPFNTMGMKAPINIQKFDEQGHLVKSYENVPPGVQNLPTGPQRGTVLETPAQMQSGGDRAATRQDSLNAYNAASELLQALDDQGYDIDTRPNALTTEETARMKNFVRRLKGDFTPKDERVYNMFGDPSAYDIYQFYGILNRREKDGVIRAREKTIGVINPSIPLGYYNRRIEPQGFMKAWGGEDLVELPYYDPVAVKPYNLLTEEEKKERREKYGPEPWEKEQKEKVRIIKQVSAPEPFQQAAPPPIPASEHGPDPDIERQPEPQRPRVNTPRLELGVKRSQVPQATLKPSVISPGPKLVSEDPIRRDPMEARRKAGFRGGYQDGAYDIGVKRTFENPDGTRYVRTEMFDKEHRDINRRNAMDQKRFSASASFQSGGRRLRDEAMRIFPALEAMGDVKVKTSRRFTSDKTGIGDIEYFAPGTKKVTYPTGKVFRHPGSNKKPAVLVNPDTNDAQSVALDLLHGLADSDPTYKRLRQEFADALDKEEVEQFYEIDSSEGKAPDGKEQWLDNYIDGEIRGLLFEGTEDDFRRNNYFSGKREEVQTFNPAAYAKYQEIEKHLKSPRGPRKYQSGRDLPPLDVYTPFAESTSTPMSGAERTFLNPPAERLQLPATISQGNFDVDEKGNIIEENASALDMLANPMATLRTVIDPSVEGLPTEAELKKAKSKGNIAGQIANDMVNPAAWLNYGVNAVGNLGNAASAAVQGEGVQALGYLGQAGLDALGAVPGIPGARAVTNTALKYGRNPYLLNANRANPYGFKNVGDKPHWWRGYEQPIDPARIDMSAGFPKFTQDLYDAADQTGRQFWRAKGKEAEELFGTGMQARRNPAYKQHVDKTLKEARNVNKAARTDFIQANAPFIGDQIGQGRFGSVYKFADNPDLALKIGKSEGYYGNNVSEGLMDAVAPFRNRGNIAAPINKSNFTYVDPHLRKNSMEAYTMRNLNSPGNATQEFANLSRRDAQALQIRTARQLRDRGIRLDFSGDAGNIASSQVSPNVMNFFDLHYDPSVAQDASYLAGQYLHKAGGPRKFQNAGALEMGQTVPDFETYGPGLRIDGETYQSSRGTGATRISTFEDGTQRPILLGAAEVYDKPISSVPEGYTPETKALADEGAAGVAARRNQAAGIGLAAAGDYFSSAQRYGVSAPLALAMGKQPNLSATPLLDRALGAQSPNAFPSEVLEIQNPYAAVGVDLVTDPSAALGLTALGKAGIQQGSKAAARLSLGSRFKTRFSTPITRPTYSGADIARGLDANAKKYGIHLDADHIASYTTRTKPGGNAFNNKAKASQEFGDALIDAPRVQRETDAALREQYLSGQPGRERIMANFDEILHSPAATDEVVNNFFKKHVISDAQKAKYGPTLSSPGSPAQRQFLRDNYENTLAHNLKNNPDLHLQFKVRGARGQYDPNTHSIYNSTQAMGFGANDRGKGLRHAQRALDDLRSLQTHEGSHALFPRRDASGIERKVSAQIDRGTTTRTYTQPKTKVPGSYNQYYRAPTEVESRVAEMRLRIGQGVNRSGNFNLQSRAEIDNLLSRVSTDRSFARDFARDAGLRLDGRANRLRDVTKHQGPLVHLGLGRTLNSYKVPKFRGFGSNIKGMIGLGPTGYQRQATEYLNLAKYARKRGGPRRK